MNIYELCAMNLEDNFYKQHYKAVSIL